MRTATRTLFEEGRGGATGEALAPSESDEPGRKEEEEEMSDENEASTPSGLENAPAAAGLDPGSMARAQF